jgi:hypothetical protein
VLLTKEEYHKYRRMLVIFEATLRESAADPLIQLPPFPPKETLHKLYSIYCCNDCACYAYCGPSGSGPCSHIILKEMYDNDKSMHSLFDEDLLRKHCDITIENITRGK